MRTWALGLWAGGLGRERSRATGHGRAVEPGAHDDLERVLRLADDVVRHKLIRLPEAEAERRGIAVPAA